jgi:MoaA/NifB/PqqE/SkfB family radical SAM enzyme
MALDAPVSVIYQVTRRCNFDCVFCSETQMMRDPSLEHIERVRDNLRGTRRVFLSGGEPLMRRDFVEIAEMFQGFVVGVPTNGTRGQKNLRRLSGLVNSVNIGLEGPRSITSRVRGNYDEIIKGSFSFVDAGLPLSVSGVVMRSILDGLPFLYQIADVLGAGKVKLIHPIQKGNGVRLPSTEFLSIDESRDLFSRMAEMAQAYAWKPGLRMTVWTPETEGYSILVFPDGKAWSWPVFGGVAAGSDQRGPEDKVAYLGDLNSETIQDIWKRYPFKVNHLRKYLGRSILMRDQGSGEYDIRIKSNSARRALPTV